MANEATLALILTFADRGASAAIEGIGKKTSTTRQNIHDLAYGFTFLGSSILGVGVALSQSQNQFTKNAGQTAIFVGGIMSAVGSSIQFIFAVQNMTKALKEMAIMQTILQALSGPKRWATLAAGVAVAGGVVYGINKFSQSQGKTAQQQTTIINNNVQGVITEQSLQEMNRSYVLKQGDRNGNSGANTRY